MVIASRKARLDPAQAPAQLLDSEANPAPQAPHDRLLTVAREMFCRDGIHATGIDRILGAANVSKMTLYGRFGSKEGLVREVLRQEGVDWRAAFFAGLPALTASGIVEALDPWFRGERFYGCAFMNAIAEHAKGEAWLRDLAAAHHREIRTALTALAETAGFDNPATLARQVMLIIDGAIAAFLISADAGILDLTRRNLDAVLASAERRPIPPA